MHVALYRSLGLHAAQRRAMVDLWLGWHQQRRVLSKSATTASAALTAAAPHGGVYDIPLIAAAFGLEPGPPNASAAANVPADPGATRTERSSRGSGSDPDSLATPPTSPAERRHPATTSVGFPAFLAHRESAAADRDGSWGVVTVVPGLQGQCPVATENAGAAVRGMHAAHAAVADQLLDFTVFLMLPGEVLQPRDVIRMMWEPIRSGSGPVDKVQLCLEAVQQQRREDVFSGIEQLSV